MSYSLKRLIGSETMIPPFEPPKLRQLFLWIPTNQSHSWTNVIQSFNTEPYDEYFPDNELNEKQKQNNKHAIWCTFTNSILRPKTIVYLWLHQFDFYAFILWLVILFICISDSFSACFCFIGWWCNYVCMVLTMCRRTAWLIKWSEEIELGFRWKTRSFDG